MPNIYKIGYTTRSPLERLGEANSSDTWKPPLPYVIEFVKQVKDVKEKEKTLHQVLKDVRINEKQEFFREELSRIRLLFALMDGEWWNTISEGIHESPTKTPARKEENEDDESISSTKASRKKLKDYLKDGQQIRHILSDNTLIATYNGTLDKLCIGTTYLSSIHDFVHHHERIVDKKVSPKISHWKLCYCNVNGTWIMADTLLPHSAK